MTTFAVTAWHMGGLHPSETAAVVLLTFGPFLAIGLVLILRRRRASAQESLAGALGESAPTRPAGWTFGDVR